MRSFVLVLGLMMGGCATEAVDTTLTEVDVSESARECGYIARCAAGYIWSSTACQCLPAASQNGQDAASNGGAETCGDGVCGAGEVCCNDSCGICTEPGGFCIELYCN